MEKGNSEGGALWKNLIFIFQGSPHFLFASTDRLRCHSRSLLEGSALHFVQRLASVIWFLSKDIVLRESAMVDDRLDGSFKRIGKIFYFFFCDEDFFRPNADHACRILPSSILFSEGYRFGITSQDQEFRYWVWSSDFCSFPLKCWLFPRICDKGGVGNS